MGDTRVVVAWEGTIPILEAFRASVQEMPYALDRPPVATSGKLESRGPDNSTRTGADRFDLAVAGEIEP